MVIRTLLKRNTYYDSIALMIAAQAVREQVEIDDVGVVMATEANRALLEQVGLLPGAFAGTFSGQETLPGPDDLLIVVRAQDEARAQAALALAEQQLASRAQRVAQASDSAPPARSLEIALRTAKQNANLAVISVAGEHAWLEAEQALRHGLHVFLFSNNVSLEHEQRLKALAADKGLLLMGPDCGTAIINGVGLGFSNVAPRGSIGIVGASGTGMQQLICLVAAAGQGISEAIGVGGRDLSESIGGIMMRRGLAQLAHDPETAVIVLVAKPSSERIVREILFEASGGKPVVAIFLGAASDGTREGRHYISANVKPTSTTADGGNVVAPLAGAIGGVGAMGATPPRVGATGANIKLARTLTEGAELAVSLAGGDPSRVPGKDVLPAYQPRLASERARLAPSQRYIRALYSGGTLSYEALLLLSEQLGAGVSMASNTPLRSEWALAPGEIYLGHTVLDLGTDEFTRGRPHPMIDPTLRLHYLTRAAQDPETAVILLDIVLGFCAHPNPASVYAPVIARLRDEANAAGRALPVIISLCGTEQDPQHLSAQRSMLEAAGALVFESNVAATLAAASFIREHSHE